MVQLILEVPEVRRALRLQLLHLGPLLPWNRRHRQLLPDPQDRQVHWVQSRLESPEFLANLVGLDFPEHPLDHLVPQVLCRRLDLMDQTPLC